MSTDSPSAPTPPADPPAQLKPTNVTEALARVIAEMPAISKDQRMGEGSQQYNYRSIEAIAGHAAALFGRYGIVPVPHKIKRSVREIQMGSGRTVWTEDLIRVKYRLYGPAHGVHGSGSIFGGKFISDFIETGWFHALARDNSDKGTNKAMTQAFKQMLIQVTMVADNRDDPDSYSPANGQPERMRPPTPAEWAADPEGGNWGSEEAMVEARKAANTALRAKVEAGEISRDDAAAAWEAYKHPDSANPDAEKLPTRDQHVAWVSRFLASTPPGGPAETPPAQAEPPAAPQAPETGPEAQPEPEPAPSRETGQEAPQAGQGRQAPRRMKPPADNGYRGHLDKVLADSNLDALIAAIAELPVTAVVTELQARGVDASGPHELDALRRMLGSVIVGRAKSAEPAGDAETGGTRRGRGGRA